MVRLISVLSAWIVLLAPASAGQAQTPCDGSGNAGSCEAGNEEELRCGFLDPDVHEIVVTRSFSLSDEDSPCDHDEHPDGPLTLSAAVDGSHRSLVLRSDLDAEPEPGRKVLTATTAMDGSFILCDAGIPADLEIEDVEISGAGLVERLFDDGGNCGLTLDGVMVSDFVPGPAGAIQIGGHHMLQIHRTLFRDVDGTALVVSGGLLTVYQSAFVNCGRSSPGAGDGEQFNGGAIRLDGVAEANLIGCLFWGNHAWTAGGALANPGSGAAWLYGCAFVGNQAPDGGAIARNSGGSLVAYSSVFAGNAATSQPAVEFPDVLTPPGTSCNFAWLDDPTNGGNTNGILDDQPLPAMPQVLDGRGGALAIHNDFALIHLAKTVLLSNGADRGGAIAVFDMGLNSDLPDDGVVGPGVPGSVFLGLSHCTLAENQATTAAAVYTGAEVDAWLVSASGLWLEHDGPPIVAEGPYQHVASIHDTTDGPPLGEVIAPDQFHAVGHICGAVPPLHACEPGCEEAAQIEFCGSAWAMASGTWRLPTALHFGRALCPDESTEPCESTGEEACEEAAGPCAWQAGIEHEFFMAEGDPLPSRGITGMACGDEQWVFPDSDLDGTPDFAECDDPAGGDLPSLDGARHPFADEVCNGMDDNCDGEVDEGLLTEWYVDADEDGYGSGEAVLSCSSEGGLVDRVGDCDDADASVSPDQPEQHGDGIDNDCDGVVDADAPGCHSAGCLATRIAPGDDGVELSLLPWMLAGGGWSVLGWRRRRR